MKLVGLLVAMLAACASAWMMTARTPVQSIRQCSSPQKPAAPVFMKQLDADLDNPMIAEDANIEVARKFVQPRPRPAPLSRPRPRLYIHSHFPNPRPYSHPHASAPSFLIGRCGFCMG